MRSSEFGPPPRSLYGLQIITNPCVPRGSIIMHPNDFRTFAQTWKGAPPDWLERIEQFNRMTDSEFARWKETEHGDVLPGTNGP
jgi:hypothetical protein